MASSVSFIRGNSEPGHHTQFVGSCIEPLGPGFWRRIDLPKADSSLVMKSSSPNGLPVPRVSHKAICPNRYAPTATPLGHELDVGLVIVITKERPLSTISSLCYEVWYSGSYYACQSSHDLRLPRNPIRGTNQVWSPRNYKLRHDAAGGTQTGEPGQEPENPCRSTSKALKSWTN